MAGLKANLRRTAETAKRRLDRIRFRGEPTGVVLMYHRVAKPASDPWGLAVSPENFAAQMAVLARRGQAATASDFAGGLGADAQPTRSVVVTFDDGYLDNLRTALPVLEREKVPATLYVMAGAVGEPRAYWWDFVARVFLETPALPAELRLEAGGASQVWRLGAAMRADAAELAAAARWDYRDPPGARARIFLEVWTHIVALSPEGRREAVDALEAWSGVAAAPAEETLARPVTEAELRMLAASPVMEIGGHTVSHPDLSQISVERARSEIVEGRGRLREMTGLEVASFAYPFGRYRPETPAIVAEAGFTNAVTTAYGLASRRNGLHELNRIEARDWTGPEFETLLDGMLGPAQAA